ncbi:MAG: hypothetical protein M1833_000094 [Piccolia ochrophora]|nr:MAG: hypothetical protein M1833_000094 [Piccolia ochrophora]
MTTSHGRISDTTTSQQTQIKNPAESSATEVIAPAAGVGSSQSLVNPIVDPRGLVVNGVGTWPWINNFDLILDLDNPPLEFHAWFAQYGQRTYTWWLRHNDWVDFVTWTNWISRLEHAAYYRKMQRYMALKMMEASLRTGDQVLASNIPPAEAYAVNDGRAPGFNSTPVATSNLQPRSLLTSNVSPTDTGSFYAGSGQDMNHPSTQE